MNRKPVFIVSLIVALWAGGLAGATVVERKDLPGLVKSAEWILEGRCIKKTVGLDRKGAIATYYTVDVTKGFRGAKDRDTVVFAFPGGELDGKGFVIAGMPTLAVNEESLLFVTEETHRGIRVPVGLGQGRFKLERDAKTGEKRLRQDLSNLQYIDSATGKVVDMAGSGVFAYETLMAQVDKLVREDDAARSAASKPAAAGTKGGK
jgi:hypothetical protein